MFFIVFFYSTFFSFLPRLRRFGPCCGVVEFCNFVHQVSFLLAFCHLWAYILRLWSFVVKLSNAMDICGRTFKHNGHLWSYFPTQWTFVDILFNTMDICGRTFQRNGHLWTYNPTQRPFGVVYSETLASGHLRASFPTQCPFVSLILAID